MAFTNPSPFYKEAKKPKQIVRVDARGYKLTPGTRVAYNMSGNTVVGTILKITPSEIHIQKENGKMSYDPIAKGAVPREHISKVKNATSVLAIHEGDSNEQIQQARSRLDASYQRTMAELDAKLTKKIQHYRDELTTLVELIGDAWDLDQVQMYLEEKLGCDIKDKEDRDRGIQNL